MELLKKSFLNILTEGKEMKLKVIIPEGYRRVGYSKQIKINDLYADFDNETWERFEDSEVDDYYVYDEFVIRKINKK